MIDILNPYIYIPSFLKIRTKSGNLEKFKPNRPQIKLLNAMEEKRKENKPVRVIILKARQMGFSTMTEADCYRFISTNSYKNGLIIAHEDPASQNIYNMFRTYYENTPEELTPMRKRMNSQELLFENPTTDEIEKRRNPGLMSSIKVASARNVNAGRSQTIQYLHCSEVAFWADAKTLVTGLFQTVPNLPGTTIVLESTANGVGGFFYETWKAAERGENDFIPLFFAWFEEPTYKMDFDSAEEKELFKSTLDKEELWLIENFDITLEQLKWRRWCIKNNCYGNLDKFHQEYPAYPDEAFIASGRPRFSTEALKEYLMQCKEGIKCFFEGNNLVEDKNGYIEIFKYPKEGEYYCIGADVAEGLVTGDYSAAYACDTDLNIVAKWHGHIDPDLFGEQLVKLAIYYNNAYLGVENNNHGLTTLKAVQRLEYYNIYHTKTYDKITDTISTKMGWSTNTKTKPLMIDKLAEFIREKYIGVKDKLFINEALTYVIDDKGGTNAQEGCNDDTVIAVGIMLQVWLEGKHESYVPTVPNEEVKKPKIVFNNIQIEDDVKEGADEFGLNQEVAL